MKDRLIELLKSPHKAEQLRKMGVSIGNYEDDCVESMVADFLLANGVIVPPCKVGDTVWFPSKYYDKPFPINIHRLEVYEEEILMYSDGESEWHFEDIGKTVFLTKDEAEKALAERSKDAEKGS